MTDQQQSDFCYDYTVADDGAVAFRCGSDAHNYPWLALHPANTIAVQATNYFSLTGISNALGKADPTKWTALTSFRWRTYQLGEEATHPTHGSGDPKADEEKPDYACSFFDRDGRLVYRVAGAGVVFRNRDFKAWRTRAKSEAMALSAPTDFQFAEPTAAGVGSHVECFVSPVIEEGGQTYIDALVTQETGFGPAHPFHDGSGDHVNSNHLCDVAQQAARLLRGGRAPFPNAGEVTFAKYVELGRAFRLTLVSSLSTLNKLSFKIEQGDHLCAELTYTYDD